MDEMISLEIQWAERAIAAIDDYGKSFDRHIGPDGPLAHELGLNAQWNNSSIL